jgi:hypothetical protein
VTPTEPAIAVEAVETAATRWSHFAVDPFWTEWLAVLADLPPFAQAIAADVTDEVLAEPGDWFASLGALFEEIHERIAADMARELPGVAASLADRAQPFEDAEPKDPPASFWSGRYRGYLGGKPAAGVPAHVGPEWSGEVRSARQVDKEADRGDPV